MLMRSDILLLMCCYVSLTLVWSKNECKKMYHYRVLLSENINLSCTMSTTCLRGLWRTVEDTDNERFLQDGCTDCGDRFAVTTNLPRGINILQVSNVSENDTDIYYCECEYTGYKSNKTERDVVACFNLTTYRPDCRLSVGVNGEIFTFDGYYNEVTKETINVTVNDKVQVNCSYGAKKKPDCSHLENNDGIVTSQSQHRCKFTCVSSKNNMTCKIRLILHPLPSNSLNSSDTSPQGQEITIFPTWSTTTSKKSSRATPQHSTSTKLTSFSTPDLFTDFPIDDMQWTQYQTSTLDFETSTNLFKSTRLPGATSAKRVHSDIVTEASRLAFSQVYITSYKSLTTSSVNVTTPNDITKPTFLIIISCAIFLISIIVALFCVHIFGLHIYGDKEEWVNPLYESADNDIQLQSVIQIPSNQYDDGEAELMEACSAPTSLKMNKLNRNQMNYKAESKEGSTIAIEVTLCDPTDTLGHGVTSFSEEFLESSKIGFNQDDNFHTLKDSNLETIGLSDLCLATTRSSSTSDTPASPHFYEVVKQFAN